MSAGGAAPGALSRILLWLFVLDLGIAFGAGLYEGRIALTHWLVASRETGLHWDSAAARRDDTGARFWVFVTTIPLTLLVVANLAVAWRAAGRLRRFWLMAGALALADRVFTFAYFVPTMLGLLQAPDSPETVATAVRWANLNYLRHAIVLAAWISALKAFALLHERRG